MFLDCHADNLLESVLAFRLSKRHFAIRLVPSISKIQIETWLGDVKITNEIQSIVGQVGDIQTLNVIQRKSVADAIGISVQDLLKISRGEQAQQQETVQDKLDITNRLLSTQNDEASEFYATQQGTRKVELAQPTFS